MTPSTVNENLNDDLFKALLDKDWEKAESCLMSGADVESGTRSRSLLLIFASRGHSEACDWLLAHGANPSARSENGHSAYHLAFLVEHEGNRDRTLKSLLEGGVPVDLADNLAVTPLQLACSHRYGDDFARQLVAAGANINARTHLGTTALLMAATKGKKDLVIDLLDAGADPEIATSEGKTILHAVIEGDDATMLPDVLARVPGSLIHRPSLSGTLPLMMSALRADIDQIKCLLEYKADPNVRSVNRLDEGATMLTILAMADRKGDVFAEALKLGARPDDCNDWGESPLARAVISGNWPVVSLLLDAGVSPSSGLDRDALSPYIIALNIDIMNRQKMKSSGKKKKKSDQPEDNSETVEKEMSLADRIDWLAKAGFPVDGNPVIPGPRKDIDAPFIPSPLGYAYRVKNWAAADQLVDLGANPCLPDAAGNTPLHHLARVSISEDMLQVIQWKRMTSKTPEQAASTEDEVKKIMTELQEAAVTALNKLPPGRLSLDVFDAKGVTPLAVAVRKNQGLLVEAFLKKGASPLACGPDAEHALSVALTTGNHTVFQSLWNLVSADERSHDILLRAAYTSPEDYRERQMLLDGIASLGAGPWLEAVDADGNTPLIVAAATAQEDMVEVLLGMGANPNHQNAAGETAAMHAVENGKGDILRMLRVAHGDLSIARSDGVTVIDMVRRSRDNHLIRSLESDDLRPLQIRAVPEEILALQASSENTTSLRRPTRP